MTGAAASRIENIRHPGRLRAAAVAALTLLAFAARAARLLTTAEPLGTDGYYYVVQVEHLLREGRPHVPDASWVLRFLAGCAAAAGSPVVGVKLGAALLAAAVVPAAFLAGRAFAARTRLVAASESGAGVRAGVGSVAGDGAAWALALWAAASPASTLLAAEFPKTLGAVAPMVAALGLAVVVALRWGSSGRAARACLGAALAAVLLLAATAHRLGAAMVALGLTGAGAGWAFRRARAARSAWRSAAVLGAIAAACLGAFALASAILPGLLAPADLERLQGQVVLGAASAPFAWLRVRRASPALIVELALAWPALLAGAVAFLRRPQLRPVLGALLLPLAVALMPPWRRDVVELGFRLAVLSPALAAPLAACVAARPLASLCSRPALARGLGLAVALASPLAARQGCDPAAVPPYARYRAVLAQLPERPALLIAHQGMSFLYGHLTWREAMAWAPEPGLDRRTIGRIAWGIRPGEWEARGALLPAAPRPVPLDRDYTYVREDVWEALAAGARAAADDDLLDRIGDWRNPSAVRPRSLLRNR